MMRRLLLNRALQACLIMAATLPMTSCSVVPDGVVPVDNFELDRYLGTWYEIARLDHRFERGLQNVSAHYALRDDGGVAVVNKGFNTNKQVWDQAEGKAYFVGDSGTGQLKVSFFGPFYGGYNIVELDYEDYQYSLVSGPSRSYLWILGRSPTMDGETLQRLVSRAADLGFPTHELIYVDQSSRRD